MAALKALPKLPCDDGNKPSFVRFGTTNSSVLVISASSLHTVVGEK